MPIYVGNTKINLGSIGSVFVGTDIIYATTCNITFSKSAAIDTITSDGSVISALEVAYNSTVAIDSSDNKTLIFTDALTGTITRVTATLKTDDAQYSYAWSGWINTSSPIRSNRTITASGTSTLKYYNITLTAGANVSSVSTSPTQQFAYGTAITKNGKNLTIAGDSNTYTGTEVDPSDYRAEPAAYNKTVAWSGPTSVSGNTTETLNATYTARSTSVSTTTSYPNTNYKGISWSRGSTSISMPGATVSAYTNSGSTFTLGITNSSGTVYTWTPTISSNSPWIPTYSVSPTITVGKKLSQLDSSNIVITANASSPSSA